MIHASRRTLLMVGASIGIAAALAGCATSSSVGGVSFGTIKAYAADAAATLDRLVPLVAMLDPSASAELTKLQASVDTAAAAFAGLTDPGGAGGQAQEILTLISDGFTIVASIPGLPPEYAAAIAAGQLLLVGLANFFNIAPAPAAALALAHADLGASRWAAAKAQYTPEAAAAADQKVRAFLAS
jgi:hypothetical protein